MSESPPTANPREAGPPSFPAPLVPLVIIAAGAAILGSLVSSASQFVVVGVRSVATIGGDAIAIACLLIATYRVFEGSERSLASIPWLGIVFVGALALGSGAGLAAIAFAIIVSTILVMRRLRPSSDEAHSR